MMSTRYRQRDAPQMLRDAIWKNGLGYLDDEYRQRDAPQRSNQHILNFSSKVSLTLESHVRRQTQTVRGGGLVLLDQFSSLDLTVIGKARCLDEEERLLSAVKVMMAS